MNDETNMDHWPMRSFEHHPSAWPGYTMFCIPTIHQVLSLKMHYLRLCFLLKDENFRNEEQPWIMYENNMNETFEFEAMLARVIIDWLN